MNDSYYRALGGKEDWMFLSCDVTQSLQEAMELKQYGTQAATLVGKMLLASAMMASLLKKSEDQLSISLQSFDGHTSLIASSNGAGEIKAYAKDPRQEEFVGPCSMNVIRDMDLREPYSSSVLMDLRDFEAGMDEYFRQSEQLETHTKLLVSFREDGKLERAFGYMIQALPNADEESRKKAMASLEGMPSLEGFLFRGSSLQEMAAYFFSNQGIATEIKKTLCWHCGCSKEKGEAALKSLGKQELRSMIAEGKTVSIDCGFCGKQYFYTIEELAKYLEECEGEKPAQS